MHYNPIVIVKRSKHDIEHASCMLYIDRFAAPPPPALRGLVFWGRASPAARVSQQYADLSLRSFSSERNEIEICAARRTLDYDYFNGIKKDNCGLATRL